VVDVVGFRQRQEKNLHLPFEKPMAWQFVKQVDELHIEEKKNFDSGFISLLLPS